MNSKSDNVEIMMGSETGDIIDELFETFLQKKKTEEEMKGSKFVFESVDLLYYSINKTILRRGRSYVKPPKWLKNKRATMTNDKCF